MLPSSASKMDVEGTRPTQECRSRHERMLIVAMVTILAAVIAVVLWVDQGNDHERKITKLFLTEPDKPLTWPTFSGDLDLSRYLNLRISVDGATKLNGNLSNDLALDVSRISDCAISTNTDICLLWEGDRRLTITHTRMAVPRLKTDVDCYDIDWQVLRCSDQVILDCYDVTDASWYGGYADKIQDWPFEKNIRTMSPYVVNDSYNGEIGGVVERYFVSSNGIGIYISDDTPLYFSLNDPEIGKMCFGARFERYPYNNNGNLLPKLHYTVCQSSDVKSVHLAMSGMFLERPSGIPNVDLFKYPIWSTWAQYHKQISQSTVLEFGNAILQHNFTHAQLEIDDDWTPAYGDMVFNEQKFPNASEMVRTLNDMGFHVTVWVHPFFNIDSKAFQEADQFGFLIKEVDSASPALVSWWDGRLAGILDPTNDVAVKWYLAKLNNLKSTYSIESFKFDAGETSWLPHIFSASNMSMDPQAIYPQAYVRMVTMSDPDHRIEVRAGYKTQKYPIFVRMMDKFSNWGHTNALKSVIPVVLTYGILGYPFVLPDMIGGNAYYNQLDAELYIRWLQLNTLLPSMQFSIVPWQYNDTIIDIARNFTTLHTSISSTLIRLARESVLTGNPIIRPLWWVAPNDTVALECEDEYLVGDEYLVAPVVENGARSRDIYFPTGSWIDMLRGGLIDKPGWVKNYRVDIKELAYFKKQST